MNTRFGFIVGTGRCGSSLVHEVVARHPAVGFVSNVDDRLAPLRLAGRFNRLVYRMVPPAASTKGRPRFAPSEAYRLIDREVGPGVSESDHDLTTADASSERVARLGRFFRRRAAAQRAPVFVHKFTGWPRVGLVEAALPGTRFLHIVRDGRAVAASWLRMPWWRGEDGPEGWHFGPLPPVYAAEWDASGRRGDVLAALAWNLLLDATDAARGAVPDAQWLELRFEDVVADPHEGFSTILSFFELDRPASFDRWLDRYRFTSSTLADARRQLGDTGFAAVSRTVAGHLAERAYPLD